MDYKTPPAVINYADPRDMKADMLRKFLEKISHLESSGGQNVDHKEMNDGIHKGTSAVGSYGIMPKTAQDIDRQSGNTELKDMSPEAIQAKLEAEPDLAKRLAETMASKLLRKNDEETASYKWLHGQYSKPSEEELKNSKRVQKFKVLGK